MTTISAEWLNKAPQGKVAHYQGSAGISAGTYWLDKSPSITLPKYPVRANGGPIVPGPYVHGFYTADNDKELFVPANGLRVIANADPSRAYETTVVISKYGDMETFLAECLKLRRHE